MTSNILEPNIKFKVDENTPRIVGMYQYSNAFAVRMIYLLGEVTNMPATTLTELLQIYLDGMVEVDKAFIKRDGKILT